MRVAIRLAQRYLDRLWLKCSYFPRDNNANTRVYVCTKHSHLERNRDHVCYLHSVRVYEAMKPECAFVFGEERCKQVLTAFCLLLLKNFVKVVCC